ncbi:MAG: hypothetical protein ACE5JP_06625 [Candidatus Bipolaricaulia bacterium]
MKTQKTLGGNAMRGGKVLVVFVWALMCVACSVNLTNRTGTNFEIADVNPGVRNDFRSRTFRLDVEREPLVFEGSIQASIVIDGVKHPMSGSGSGEWTYSTDDRDPQNPGRLRDGYDVQYEVRYQYLPLPLPFPLPGKQTLPSQGTLYFDVRPEVFAERDDPLFFLNTNITKEVSVTNLSLGPVTLTTIEMRPFGGPGIGDLSGTKFEFVAPPQMPLILASGEGVTIAIRFTGFTLAQGILAIETDHPDHPLIEFALMGRVF